MLTLVFIILKLNGVIDWDWIWVFSPIWISILTTVGIIVIELAIAVFSTIIETIKDFFRR